jgi:hypothetical protein
VAAAAVVVLLLLGAATPSSAGAWTAPLDLSGTGENATTPQVAVDAAGDAVFAWRRHDGTTFRAQARARSSAGVLSTVQTLSPAAQNVFLDEALQLGVDADSDAVFTWQDFNTGLVQARTRSSAGILGPVQTLSDAGQSASPPRIAVDPLGDAAVTWKRSDGTNDRIQAAFGP